MSVCPSSVIFVYNFDLSPIQNPYFNSNFHLIQYIEFPCFMPVLMMKCPLEEFYEMSLYILFSLIYFETVFGKKFGVCTNSVGESW